MVARGGTGLVAAAAQIATRPGAVEENSQRHRAAIVEARAAGADVLVFPELSLVGHSAGARGPDIAMRAGDPRLLDLAEASGDLFTVVGFVEEAPAALFFNSAAVLHRGRVVHLHRKVNLATYGRLEDGKHFAAGDARGATLDLSCDWRAAVLICADAWHPPLVHQAALAGATLLLLPISSGLEAVGEGFDNPAGWEVNARFHATTYGLPLVLANRVGIEDGLCFWGGSRILDPFGRSLAAAEGQGEALVVATLDYGALRRARFLLPTLRDSHALATRITGVT